MLEIIFNKIIIYIGRAGFRGARGPRAPGFPPTGGLLPNPSIFKTL